MGKDIIWTFSLQIAIMFCSFAITKLLANRMIIDDFGQYNVIKRSVQVISFVMLAGVGVALPRYIPLYRKGESQRPITPLISASLIYIIGVTLIVCLFCGVFSKEMQQLMLGQAGNTPLFIIALAYAFALAMAQFAFAYFRGIGDFRWYNWAQFGIQLAILIPLFFLPMLTTTIVFSSWLIITSLLVVFYLGRATWKRKVHLGFVTQNIKVSVAKELKTIVRYSFGRLLADFFLFSLAAFPLIYISNTQGLQPTAFFSVGITFVTMVTPLFSIMGIILLPYVSEAIAKHELIKANRFIMKLTLFYIVSSLLITIFIYIFINFLTILFFSGSYIVASDLSRIMIFAILPQALYLLYRNPIDAVSVIPYNTIILGISLAAMIICFALSSTLTQLAWAYLGISVLKGIMSWGTWSFLKNKKRYHGNV